METQPKIGSYVEAALEHAAITQRQLAGQTGIAQSTISRIVRGNRQPTVPELIKISESTGYSLTQLTGTGVSQRLQTAARSVDGASMTQMRERLEFMLELDAFLDDQAIYTD